MCNAFNFNLLTTFLLHAIKAWRVLMAWSEGQGPHVQRRVDFLLKLFCGRKNPNPDASSLRKHAFTQILFVHPK